MFAVASADDDRPVRPINRVTQNFLWPGLVHQNRQPNIASLLKEKAGYEVVWKGKWHLSYASNAAIGNGGEDWTEADIKVMEENYGWSGWNPPDAGNAIVQWQPNEFGKFNGLATLGGGDPDNDGRYVNGRRCADVAARRRDSVKASSSISRIARPSWASRFACSFRWSIRTTFTSIRISGRWPAISTRLSSISESRCRPTMPTISRRSPGPESRARRLQQVLADRNRTSAQ